LGISFQYPSSWPDPTVLDDKNCFTSSDSCSISFGLGYQPTGGGIENVIIGVRVNKLNEESKSVEYSPCFCHSLADYMKWDYNRAYKEQSSINDNQTTIANNYYTWQMEVVNKDNGYKTLVTWAINGDIGYRFLYSAPPNGYTNYLKDFKNLLGSVKFEAINSVVSNPVGSKVPSFMSSSKASSVSNNSITSNTTSTATAPVLNSNEISVDDTEVAPSTDYLEYSDDDIGFRLKYPSDWETDTSNTEHSTVLSLKSPNDDVSVNVRIFPKEGYKSIKDFGDKTFKESEDNTLLQYYRNSSTLLSGKPAIKVIYLTTYNPSIFENAYGYKSSTSKAMMTATVVPEKKSIFSLVYFATSELIISCHKSNK
jgi:hypothetical protein